MKNFTKYSSFLILTLIFLTSLLAFIMLKDKPPLIDENQHYETIKEISSFQINENTFTRSALFPGYFLVIGILSSFFKIDTLAMTRFLSLVFSFFSFFTFYLLAKTINHKGKYFMMLQYFFFPIIFIFFFLLYTDILSLWLLMLSFYLLIKKHYHLSSLIGVLSIFIKQSNIVWLGFFCFFLFMEQYWPFTSFQNLINFSKKIWIYIFTFIGFLLFVFINQGVTFGLGNKMAVPISIHFGNLYLFLFIFFFFFLPLNLRNSPKIYQLIKKQPFTIIIVLIIFFFYLATFKVDHLWNTPVFNFFLRNTLLNLVVSSLFNKFLFFLPIAYSLLSLMVTKLNKVSYYTLYPITLIFLILPWLIEPRYYFVPFTFFILFKENISPKLELLTIIMYVALTSVLFLGSLEGKFFL